jgi:hypothetical protein
MLPLWLDLSGLLVLHPLKPEAVEPGRAVASAGAAFSFLCVNCALSFPPPLPIYLKWQTGMRLLSVWRRFLRLL